MTLLFLMTLFRTKTGMAAAMTALRTQNQRNKRL